MTRLACLLALACAATAAAHDFWLEPSDPRPKAGAEVKLHLHVGDGFATEGEKALTREGTPSFDAWLAGVKISLMPEARALPAARLKPAKEGTCLVALERSPRLITLEADKFRRYLGEESLVHILAERKKRGEDANPGRERYGRGIKLLLRAGAGDDGWKRVVGHKLEIVPRADPTGKKAGDTLRVAVLFGGKPLPDATLTAYSRQGEKVTTGRVKLSKGGEADVALAGGFTLLRLVHMWRADGKEADWESAWAALSFDVPPAR